MPYATLSKTRLKIIHNKLYLNISAQSPSFMILSNVLGKEESKQIYRLQISKRSYIFSFRNRNLEITILYTTRCVDTTDNCKTINIKIFECQISYLAYLFHI